jgi:hypothetical protein
MKGQLAEVAQTSACLQMPILMKLLDTKYHHNPSAGGTEVKTQLTVC